jgi:hypothetical protein
MPDNLKAAVIRAAFNVQTELVLNRSYRELARHYGFLIDPTPAYSPQKKGKVEAAVRYVKRNFMATIGDERDITVLNGRLEHWVIEVAGKRTHGTTRQQPLEVFEQIEQIEKAAMRPLPSLRWRPISWRTPNHCLIDGARYSAPWRLIGKRLLAAASRRSWRGPASGADFARRASAGGCRTAPRTSWCVLGPSAPLRTNTVSMDLILPCPNSLASQESQRPCAPQATARTTRPRAVRVGRPTSKKGLTSIAANSDRPRRAARVGSSRRHSRIRGRWSGRTWLCRCTPRRASGAGVCSIGTSASSTLEGGGDGDLGDRRLECSAHARGPRVRERRSGS